MADPNTDPLTVQPPPTPQSLMEKAQAFADANKVTALTNEFDESKSTAGRVASIIDENSPLMQRARVEGAQRAAAGGYGNSSLGGQAEQLAVLDKATPIASADASLYSQNSLANLAARNQAAIASAGNATTIGNTALAGENSNAQQDKLLAQNQKQFEVTAGQSQQQIDAQISQFAQQLGLTQQDLQLKRDTLTSQQQQFLAGLENQKAIAQLQATTSLATANISADTQKTIANLDNATKLDVAKISAANQADIQSNTNIANAWGSTMTNIANIQNNPNLEEAAKRTLIQNNLDSFQAFSTFWKGTVGTAPDISPLLQFNMANATAPTTGGSAPTSPYYDNSGLYPPGVNPGFNLMNEPR